MLNKILKTIKNLIVVETHSEQRSRRPTAAGLREGDSAGAGIEELDGILVES